MAIAAVTAIMAAMSFLAALFLTASASPPVTTPQATAVGIARARILSRAEVRRVDGRLEVRTSPRETPTQVHRTMRRDGGETADFY